jgi:hypothetical protein
VVLDCIGDREKRRREREREKGSVISRLSEEGKGKGGRTVVDSVHSSGLLDVLSVLVDGSRPGGILVELSDLEDVLDTVKTSHQRKQVEADHQHLISSIKPSSLRFEQMRKEGRLTRLG